MNKIFNITTKSFWIISFAEMIERAMFWAVFIILSLYLTRILRFSDIETGFIVGFFLVCKFLEQTPIFKIFNKINEKNRLLLSLFLLIVGYLGLAVFPSMVNADSFLEFSKINIQHGINTNAKLSTSNIRWLIIPVLFLIPIGSSFFKSIISLEKFKETSAFERIMNIFEIVNSTIMNLGFLFALLIIFFFRKTTANFSFIYINYFCSALSFVLFILILFQFKTYKYTEKQDKKTESFWRGVKKSFKLLFSKKLILLVIIFIFLTTVQIQVLLTVPKYILRNIGDNSYPSLYIGAGLIFLIFLTKIILIQLNTKNPVSLLKIELIVMFLSTILLALGNSVNEMKLFIYIVSIIFLSSSQIFIFPLFFKIVREQISVENPSIYIKIQAIIYSLSIIIGSVMSGFLFAKYLPDPSLPQYVTNKQAWLLNSQHAHYIWLYFSVLIILSFILFIIYKMSKNNKKINN